jgi:hypothetical protein
MVPLGVDDMNGSLRCSMLPHLSEYVREDTPALVEMREKCRILAEIFPYVVCWEAPFYTPDGWDYDWGYILCTDIGIAEMEARECDSAGVYKTEIVKGTDYDHPHSPEGWCRMHAGEQVLNFMEGRKVSNDQSRFEAIQEDYNDDRR